MRTIWSMRGPADARPQRIVPDGRPEIVFNFSEPMRRLDGGRGGLQPRVLAIGQLTGPMSICSTGPVDLIGVRFEPGGLHALLGVSLAELVHAEASLDALVPRAHGRLWDAARRDREGAGVSSLCEELLRLADESASMRRRGDVVTAAVGLLRAERDIASIARELGVSTRTLERRFRASVGLGPKALQRTLRFAGVVAALRSSGRAVDGAMLALRHGYCDQPHLIREFRSLAGMSPERFRREEAAWVDQFSGVSDLSNLDGGAAR